MPLAPTSPHTMAVPAPSDPIDQSRKPVLELKQATKSYPGAANAVAADEPTLLLDDVSLKVYPGDRIGVFSARNMESIALINCLAGIASLDQGELIHHASVSWPVGANEALDHKLSGYANARFAVEIYEKPENHQVKIELIRELAELSNDQFHSAIASYSAKQLQTYRLALSLAFDFDCYLIGRVGDDWKQKGERRKPAPIFAYMRQRLEGKTLLISSAKQAILALRYCTSGIALIDGKIAHCGEPRDCLEMALDHRQYLTQKQIESIAASDPDDVASEALEV